MKLENSGIEITVDEAIVVTKLAGTATVDQPSSEVAAKVRCTSTATGTSRRRSHSHPSQSEKRRRQELLPQTSQTNPLQAACETAVPLPMNSLSSTVDVTISSREPAPTPPPAPYLTWRSFPRPGWNSYPLDWRWQLASHIAVGGKKPIGLQAIDTHVKTALAYLRSDSTQLHGETALPDTLHTGVAEAVRLHEAGGLQRAVIEARILAREDVATIAAKTGIAPATVNSFASLFFDITGREKTSILFHLVFPSVHTEGHVKDVETLMKLIAHGGGSIALEEYLWYLDTPKPTVPRNFRQTDLHQLKHLRRWCNIQRFVLSDTVIVSTDREKILLARAAYNI